VSHSTLSVERLLTCNDRSQLTSDQYWANVTKVEEMEDVLDQLIDVEGGTGLLGENLDIPGFVGERPITIGGEINSRESTKSDRQEQSNF